MRSPQFPGSPPEQTVLQSLVFARLCARGGDAEINVIVMPSRASQSDGQGSPEDKLLEAIYRKAVVNNTWK